LTFPVIKGAAYCLCRACGIVRPRVGILNVEWDIELQGVCITE